MFLLNCLVTLSIIFWVCAAVSELLLTSKEEKPLPPAIRVALAYFIVLAWFVGSWKMLPMSVATGLGLLVLILYILGLQKKKLDNTIASIKNSFRAYLIAFVAYLVLANLFFLPLHIAGYYGPFTERGGDVSVYADTAKFLADRELPAYGYKDFVYDFKHYVANPLNTSLLDNTESLASFDRIKGNPPTADYQVYRMNSVKRYCLVQFAPTGIWSFLASDTNYHVFFATMAFLYACSLLSLWYFFREFGRAPAIMGVLLAVGSHGFISVFYNMYFLQGMCLAISALFLGIAFHVKVFSIAGLRTYWLQSGIVAAAYLHFIAVLLPIMMVIALRSFILQPDDKPAAETSADDSQEKMESSFAKRSARWSTILIFSSFFLVSIGMDTWGSVGSYKPVVEQAIKRVVSGEKSASVHMGDALDVFSAPWFNYFFGAFSQQHYPLMATPQVILKLIRPVGILGIGALLLGFFPWVLLGKTGMKEDRRLLFLFILYLAASASALSHHAIVQMSMYTQAKGAQNVLLVLFATMVMPFAAIINARSKNWKSKACAAVLGLALLAFGASLSIPRMTLAAKLAYNGDAGTIMDGSFYKTAEHIRESDGNPLVWFEPARNADLYLSIQPFAGARMVPTRHLALATEYVKNKKGEPFGGFEVNWNNIAGDFVSEEDIPHIWLLTASEKRNDALLTSGQQISYDWSAERLAGSKRPRFLFSGHYYEKFYDKDRRSENPADAGWYTYIRKGSVMAYLPAGKPYDLETKVITGRNNKQDFADIQGEMENRLNKGEFGKQAEMSSSSEIITIKHRLPESGRPRLLTLARSEKEFMVNIRVNSEELGPQ